MRSGSASPTAPPIGAGTPTSCAARSWRGPGTSGVGALAGALDHSELDASVLLLPELGLLPASDERFVRTCAVIGKELNRNGFIMRYTADDDFGAPETAFLVCQFWYIDALAALGRKEEAREMFADLLSRRNAFGLLSEDIHPVTGQLWGNLPQTYSMAGIVNTGRILSRSWQEAWAQLISAPLPLSKLRSHIGFGTPTRVRRNVFVTKRALGVRSPSNEHQRQLQMSRVVLVSNRVLDLRKAAQAGGVAVALADIVRTRPSLWFGWNGEIKPPEECRRR